MAQKYCKKLNYYEYKSLFKNKLIKKNILSYF